jgi:heptosyltransferase-2
MNTGIKLPNWVGDVVMATSAMKSIRLSFPDDKIYAIVRPGHRGLLEGTDLCDKLISVDDTGFGVLSQGVGLRKLHLDRAVILPRGFRAGLLMRLSGASERIGFAASGRSSLLTQRIVYEPRINTRDMYLRICRGMGCSQISEEISLPVSPDAEERAEEILAELDGRPIVGIVPGGSYGSAKLWPVEHFGRTASIIRDRTKAVFIVLHAPGEEDIAQKVRDASDASLALSEGLEVLKSIVRRLDLLLTNDTGPRHIGVAFGVPTVVLMGPTHTEYTDYTADRLTVVREDIECSPCQLKTCPRDHECMEGLAPERVADECLEALSR